MNLDIWGSPFIAGGQVVSQIFLAGWRPKLSGVQASVLCPILLGENAPRERKVTLDSVKHRGGLWHSTPLPSSVKLLASLWKEFTDASGLEAGAVRDKPTSEEAKRWASPRLKSISKSPSESLQVQMYLLEGTVWRRSRQLRPFHQTRLGSADDLRNWKPRKQMQRRQRIRQGEAQTTARYWPLSTAKKSTALFPQQKWQLTEP